MGRLAAVEASEVVKSETSRRNKTVCCRAGRGVVGRIEERHVFSQAVDGGKCRAVRNVVRFWVWGNAMILSGN